MGRPRTHGPTITFRLPLELHDYIAERAEQHGMSVNDYIRDRYIQSIQRAREISDKAAARPYGAGKGPTAPRPKTPTKGPKT